MQFPIGNLLCSKPSNPHLYLFTLFWWLLVTTITLSPSPVSCLPKQNGTEQGTLCKEIEREALLTFKAGLINDTALRPSWSNDNPDCCNWVGISCNNQTGHVLDLDLRGYSLEFRGEVSSSLLELNYLQYLDLSLNSFGGSTDIVVGIEIIFRGVIPSFLGSFEKLRYLNLSFSFFYGEVPPHLGNLSSLEYLDLQGNYGLKTKNLEWLAGLSSLKHLNLNDVRLYDASSPGSGGPAWLKTIHMLPSLLELHLSGCGLLNLPLSISHSINFTSLLTLDLSYNNFYDSFDIPLWLFNLTGLVKLNLSHSLYNDPIIPDKFGKLVKLQHLDLSSNGIRGQFPASLGNLTNLVMLNLGNNAIEGILPVSTFGNLCKLRTLNLQKNCIGGDISQFFDGLARCSNGANMEFLTLGNNEFLTLGNDDDEYSCNSFYGSIPNTIARLTSLRTLDLSNNKMNGTIPEAIGQLSDLEVLDLSGNLWYGLLTGTHFQKHTKLKVLSLSTTSKKSSLIMDVRQDWLPPFRNLTRVVLDGIKMRSKKFPRWVQTRRKLQFLSLADCGISDSIPTEFWKSNPNIISLSMPNNALSVDSSFKNFEGTFPFFLPNLESLNLANISLSGGGGEILSNIGPLAPSLLYLDLSSNSISGNLPLSISRLKQLNYLILRNNLFSGEIIHHQWEEMSDLQVLDVSNNRLVGKIPKSLGLLTHIKTLFLNDNHLGGKLPDFRSCTCLEILNVGGNNLTGTIPTGLAENQPELVVLRLRGNMLSGTIPSELCLLSNLLTLDLAHNNFQGFIPGCFGNLSKLGQDAFFNRSSIPYGITLVTKGREYKYGYEILRLVHLVDLSENNLSGRIPESLMKLTALQTLNLSMNHLTGEIPSNIGVLRMLESLDLSQNQLSGPIPASLAGLSFLSALNLSHNNLSGKILLAGTQLQTLNDSSRYEGNPLLCGPPLLTKCPEDGPTNDGDEGKENRGKKRFNLDEWGLVLSLILGFIVGFWGICGSLAINASWREAYFGYLIGIKDKIVVTVIVNFARLRRKMGDAETRN